MLGSAVELALVRIAATSFWHSSARPSVISGKVGRISFLHCDGSDECSDEMKRLPTAVAAGGEAR